VTAVANTAVTAVVHLVWGPAGVEPLRDFLRSYRQHDPGADHELVVVFNGVPEGGADGAPQRLPRGAHAHYAEVKAPEREAFLAELKDIPHRLVELERPVHDLSAYAVVAERIEHERVCVLNSFSTILAPRWLEMLSAGLARPGVGIVAATGSWASLRSWVTYSLWLPSPYRHVLPGRRTAKRQFRAIEAEREGAGEASGEKGSEGAGEAAGEGGPAERGEATAPHGRTTMDRLRELPMIPEQLIRFGTFPAPHLRTNGFMVERQLLRSLRMDRIARKMGAYSLESGRNSITRQIQRRGLRALVVARDGELYEPERWPESHTFWQGDQEGLLIADNQTRFYANGPLERRRLLSAFAWGRQADPGHPTDPVRS
jgi:hypothetical protein